MIEVAVSYSNQSQTRQNQYRATTRSRSATPSQPNTQSNHFDISNLLRVIAPQQQQPTPPPQPVTQAPMSDLERTVNLFRQQQQPVQPQMPQYPTTQAPGGFDFQKLLSALNVQPQMQQPPVVPTQPPAAAAPNLAAIVSQFANQNQQGGAGQGLNPGQFHEDPERKRMRERGYDDSYDDKFNPPKRTGQIGLTKHVSTIKPARSSE